ncbi:MAG: HD domain-containing protein [Lentisphaerae bacterium]|nr:HD domain-containing protein [Lentisphaerota bacterium]
MRVPMGQDATDPAGWALALRAADYAARALRADRRRGDETSPYMNHVLEVAALLAEATGGRDPLLVTAALLHDLPARTQIPRETLEHEFGREAAGVVYEAHMVRGGDREERRRDEIDRAPGMSPRARQLKLADKTSSVRGLQTAPPPGWGPAEALHYLDWADAVAAGCAGVNPALDRLYAGASDACRAHWSRPDVPRNG